jgi:hypothetical protein
MIVIVHITTATNRPRVCRETAQLTDAGAASACRLAAAAVSAEATGNFKDDND